MSILKATPANALSSQPFCNFHGWSDKIHALVTANRRSRSRQPAEVGSPKHENQEPRAVNRPKSAVAAVLMTMLASVRATAQQAPLTLQRATNDCSGCFAYLEFPPSAEGDTPSSRATSHQATPPPTTSLRLSPIREPAPDLVASARQ